MTPPMTPPTMGLAQWVADTGSQELPADVRHQVRRSLVDYLAAAVVGAGSDAASIVRGYLREHDHAQRSTVIATRTRLGPAGAALANGVAAHALDLDDGYTPAGGHPGCTVVSAALAAAEAHDGTAADLERAIAVGYEVACRIGSATHPGQWRRGFHNTPLFGVFGAATATAAILGLGARAIANAYGLAGSHAGGLRSYHDEGSDLKRYHAGKAARDGLVTAELASRGLTGPTNVLEGSHGYVAAFAGDAHLSELVLAGLGSTWLMRDTYQKPYPCCRHVHAAVDAALKIRARTEVGTSIDSIRVETFSIAATYDNKDIHSVLDAQMSLPYAVAAALVHGQVGMAQFEDDARSDRHLRDLMEAVEVVVDEDLDAAYPSQRPARVVVGAGGREYVEEVMQPYGEPGNPMSDDAIDAKFHRLVEPVLGRTHTTVLAEAAWALDDAPALFAALWR